jgi:hypothetical protein
VLVRYTNALVFIAGNTLEHGFKARAPKRKLACVWVHVKASALRALSEVSFSFEDHASNPMDMQYPRQSQPCRTAADDTDSRN